MSDVEEPVLVKFTESPVHFGALEVNEATVVESIIILIESPAVHEPLFTENVISLVPGEEYITPAGLSVVEVAGEAPVPKSQLYVTPAPVVPVFVKLTELPSHCGALEVNVAVGVWLMLIVWVVLEEQPVELLVTVSVIV